jgi:uncharacterized membrane protein
MKHTIKFFSLILITILSLLSCSQQTESKTDSGDFSQNSAVELAEIIKSERKDSNQSIVETSIIGVGANGDGSTINSYRFEGSEPFWSLRIKNDSIHVEMMDGDSFRGIVKISNQSTNSGTYAIGFSNNKIYGIINKTWDGNCSYAVSEKDSMGFEVYFVYKNKPYRGCGEIIK